MGWLDVLIGGVGTGIGGVGQAVAGAREKRREREQEEDRRKFEERKLAEQTRQFYDQQGLQRELAFAEIDPTSVPEPFRPLVTSFGRPSATGTIRIPRTLMPTILGAAEQEQERRRLEGAAEGVAGRILTEGTQQPVRSMVDPDIAPAGQPFVDPQAQRSADLVRLAAVNPALASVLERATQPEKLTSVAPGGRLIGERTGRVVAEGAPREPTTNQSVEEIGGRQVVVTRDRGGNVINKQDIGPARPRVVPIPQGGTLSTVDFGGEGGAPRVTPLTEGGAVASELAKYRHKETLELPPPGTKPSELKRDYIVADSAQVQTRSVLEENLRDAERVIERRKDLFPEPTGNGVWDAVNRRKAQVAMIALREAGDEDVQTLDSLRGMMMQIQRAFGGTSRQMDSIIELLRTERAFHIEGGSARASREQVRVLRDRLNRAFGTQGLPPMKEEGGKDRPDKSTPKGGNDPLGIRRGIRR